MRIRILYGVSLLVMLYLNVMYHWEAGRTLLGAMIVLPFLCEALAWIAALGIKADFVCAAKRFQESEHKKVWLQIRSTPILTALSGRIRAEVEVIDSGQSCQRKWIWVSGEKTELSDLFQEGTEPGVVTFRIRRIRTEDAIGLGMGYRRNVAECSVTILPEIVIPHLEFSEQIRNFLLDSDTYSKTKSGEDVSEVFGLREYRPGDSWQKVHWKMTARQEHIWVKEYSLPIGASVVLAAENGRKEKILGNFIRAFASLASGFLAYECPCYATWRMAETGQIKRFLLSVQEDYDEMLTVFLKDCREGIGNWDEESYQEAFSERYGRCLVLKEDGTLFVDEEKVWSVAMEKAFREQFLEAVIEV